MQYSIVAVAALAAGASASYNVSYTTEVVDSYTTFCPYATQLTHAEKTYTVTEATLLTITNCPCTLTKPVIPVTSAKSVAPVVVPTSTYVAPVKVTSVAPVVVTSAASVAPAVVTSAAPAVVTSVASAAPPIYVNTTTPVVAPVAPSTTSAPAAFKGAASTVAASGFSLAGVLAIAAYLL